jgi:hypothetical protein
MPGGAATGIILLFSASPACLHACLPTPLCPPCLPACLPRCVPPACLQVSVVTFDKTGTLTKGTFQVMSCEVGG